MSHVDAMPTGYATIDLSTRTPLRGYQASASLIADVARYLGLTDLLDSADDTAALISGLIHDLNTMPVEPSADEWDDALAEADWRLYQLEQRLYDATGGTWFASAYEGSYVVAPADWWDALEV